MLQSVDVKNVDYRVSTSNFHTFLNDFLFTRRRLVWVLFELSLVFIFCIIGYKLSPYSFVYDTILKTLPTALIYTVTHSFLSIGLGQYERVKRFSVSKILLNGSLAMMGAALVASAFAYFLYYNDFGRLTVLWGAATSFVGLLLVRLVFSALFSLGPYKFTIVSGTDISSEVIRHLSEIHHKEARYFQYIPVPQELPFERIWDFIIANKVFDVVVNPESMAHKGGLEFISRALEYKIRIIDEIQFYAEIMECLPIQKIAPSYFIHSGLNLRALFTEASKRFFDVAACLLALTILSPLLLSIALIIRLTSRGEVIFVQPRQGRFGRSFSMYKFRTMHSDVSRADAGGGFTQKADARVTLIGKILRPLHIDELPQLLNILKGEMSIVGPRPEALSFALRMTEQISLYKMRYVVRPGLTGHAQLKAGYMMDTLEDTKRKLSFDLFYIMNHSLMLDFGIILRTAFIVIKKLMP